MNVYVETNFILELALLQEQHESCRRILQMCEAGRALLIVPAYALAEPYDTLTRRLKGRERLADRLGAELAQLARTVPYSAPATEAEQVVNLLLRTGHEEIRRLESARQRVSNAGHLVPLNAPVLDLAAEYQSSRDLAPQDAIVYASIIVHLTESKPEDACFFSRDAKDFGASEIRNELAAFGCRFIPRFDHGVLFLESSLQD